MHVWNFDIWMTVSDYNTNPTVIVLVGIGILSKSRGAGISIIGGGGLFLSFIDLEWGGFGEILPEVMIFSPAGNIITEGNISPNPQSGGSINDILYRKLKASKLRIKNLTHIFVNTMFHFRINASIVAFLSNHVSFEILMTTFFKICFKMLKKPQVLHHLPRLFITHQYNLYFVGHVVVMRVVSRGLREEHVPRGTWGGTLSKGTQAR
jgi:hypothetical protein